MSGKHRTKPSRSNLIVGSIAASVGVSSVLAAAIVEVIAPEPPTAASQPAPQPVTQQGTVTSLTPGSFTTRSTDGITQTPAGPQGRPMDYGL